MNRIFQKMKKGAVALMAATAFAVTTIGGKSAHAAGATLTEPTMPDSTGVMQKMVDTFGTAGTYAIVVIGAAVALGIIVILAMYTWRLLKKWLSSAK